MARPKLDEDRTDSLDRSERPKRIPINGYRDKLAVIGKEAGWDYCWVNDNNVDRYLDAGYEHVTHPVTVGHRRLDNASTVGSGINIPVGNGVTAYLMRIPEELRKEDMESYNREVDEGEATMFQKLNSHTDGTYGKVNVSHGSNSYRKR